MKSSDTTNDAISRLASRLRIAIFAVMAVMVILYGAARFGLQFDAARVEARAHSLDAATGRLIADVTLLLLVVAFFQLTRMLGRLASGERFSGEVIGYFRSFAFWLLLTALFGLAAQIVAPLINGDGSARFHVVLDFQKLLMVAITLVLFLLARLLERARRLEEEMREFI
ncbi:MAG TPA: DUF2975 domain-containing protein [Sphingomicrobium sp.]